MFRSINVIKRKKSLPEPPKLVPAPPRKETTLLPAKQMHNTTTTTTGKLFRINNDAKTIKGDLNCGNVIFLRGARSSDGGHLVIGADGVLGASKTNVLLDGGDATKRRQLVLQQTGARDGVLLQSVKRFSAGTPILLLGTGDKTNGHFLIQTSPVDDSRAANELGEEQAPDVFVQAVEGLQDGESCNARNVAAPLGSGE